MKRVLQFLRKNRTILIILFVGLLLRIYKPLEFYAYGHDQDLAGWMVKDILFNKHLRLIGQETSSQGIFIGPLFYYLQIPFYFLTKMDPVGTLLLPLILGLFSIFSFFFVFSKVFDRRTGFLAALIYAVSTVIVFTDRDAVPTMPAMLWTVWYFYCLWQVIKGNQKFYILAGVLFGLVWHINLALAILSPLIVLAHFFSKKRLDIRNLALGIGIFVIFMSPFILFETRHNFGQIKAIYVSFTSQKDYVPGTGKGLNKLDRVLQLVHVNTRNIYWGGKYPIPIAFTFYLLTGVFLLLVLKKIIPRGLGLIMFLWQIMFIVFFTFNSINVSEYYLNGMNIIWIVIGALGFGYLLKRKETKRLGVFLVALFVFLNIVQILERSSNRSGYLERKAIVAYIDADAKAHGYPCVSVSYITSVGSDLGYRYLFWLRQMHVNQPISGSPVYSIVFPLSKVSRVDKTFGALGLVLPDYERYTEKKVTVSCSGANSNLTDPMFGYTE